MLQLISQMTPHPHNNGPNTKMWRVIPQPHCSPRSFPSPLCPPAPSWMGCSLGLAATRNFRRAPAPWSACFPAPVSSFSLAYSHFVRTPLPVTSQERTHEGRSFESGLLENAVTPAPDDGSGRVTLCVRGCPPTPAAASLDGYPGPSCRSLCHAECWFFTCDLIFFLKHFRIFYPWISRISQRCALCLSSSPS